MDSTVGAPWTITQDQIDALLNEASHTARSVRSEQVWSWNSTGGVIELIAGLPPVADQRHRSLMLEAGALLLNLRLLIRGLGVLPTVRVMPDPGRPSLVAAIRLDGPRPVTDQDRSLVAALLTGPPSWSPAAAALTTAPTNSFMRAMRRAAKAEQTWLAAQPMTTFDGLDLSEVAGTPTLAGTALIVGTLLDGATARLQAGQAAQRVVLTAAALDVPITARRSESFSDDADRRRVRELIGGGLWPQAVLQPDTGIGSDGAFTY